MLIVKASSTVRKDEINSNNMLVSLTYRELTATKFDAGYCFLSVLKIRSILVYGRPYSNLDSVERTT